jgi:hypothetical protein
MEHNIDWDYFPEPYNQELPFYIGKAFQRLSPEGVEVLNEVMVLAHKGATGQDLPEAADPADIGTRLGGLPEEDSTVVRKITGLMEVAFSASMEKQRGEMDLLRQAQRIVDRARELDPTLDPDMPLEEAVAALKRHGETAGISDEVLEMEMEVPATD